MQFATQGVVAGFRTQRAAGRRLGGGFEDARGNQGQGAVALAAGFGIPDGVEFQVPDGSRDGRGVTVGGSERVI